MNRVATLEAVMVNGQKRNITQVINDYSKRLLGFIKKRVSNDEDAEDILQDVFYQFIGNTQPIEQLTGWLYTVARNKITDRKRKHKPELLDDIFSADEDNGFSWTDLFFNAANNPETEYLKNIFWETLNTALDELPEDQKLVFVQNELEGISFKEISATTGISVNTLLSRKRYAVLHLRERLKTLKNELINY
ncbi:MAG TPA: RNA polymerase sigma factor [Chitinophagaceae bacterium]|jgi:RNA polymerase sigma factor (sigma-70 family)|nr:RNA polymerase sigma factor [Chitinophagaceae bacterium]MBP9740772.1 RNA polymerase sigma factor [Chitinophagaceae bacterium]HPH23199.1 RNA polymerase sigma factor [Chitinophagaceae bacterium]